MQTIALEDADEKYEELKELYQEHYIEMCDRLKGIGVDLPPYNPRLGEYKRVANAGAMISIVARNDDDKPIGYFNIYITLDMQNQDLVGSEVGLFVSKDCRNGIGKKLIKFGLDEMRSRGVKRYYASAVTDLRTAKLWERMGFKHYSHSMLFNFAGE
jgi:GNAT superfamily N-acetyltransferase